MNKMKVSGNSFFNDRRKEFQQIPIPYGLLEQVKNFAYEMCFGYGHHRQHRTGGQYNRKGGELFCNTFQGKLAEVVVRNYFLSKGLQCGNPDFSVYGEGIWDDLDLMVNEKSLSVKSAAFFSNLLLLETKDYDSNGNYLPNLNIGATANYDFYILVRIKPDIKSIFRKERLFYSNDISKEEINRIISSEQWYYDIVGWISHLEFVEVIRNKNIIPQNSFLNGKTKMDAENYYIQSGDMHPIEELCNVIQ